MNYFIDFEANISNEIISIGCVREDGEIFSSLVKPNKKINPFIETLTGITNEMVNAAPDADVIFANFYHWIYTADNCEESAVFYCYGDCDITFVKKTLNKVTQLEPQLALSLIVCNLIDYQGEVKRHFKIDQPIGLVKLISYYRKEEIEQSHDALEDALWLKEVYDNIQEEKIEECPFPKYRNENISNSTSECNYICSCKKRNVTVEVKLQEDKIMGFRKVGEAADWLIEKRFPTPQKDMIDRERICRRIVNAMDNNKLYFGLKWNRKEKENV